MTINKNDSDSIEKTAQILKSGGICILPTDTVYGFSGIVGTKDLSPLPEVPTDVKIRAIKGRSETKPLIQLIAKPQDLSLYTNDDIPDELLKNWPGPLTIIVHISENAALTQEAKLPTIAFRCPGDLWLRKVIEKVGSPIYSTSVNRSGQPVLDTEAAIEQEFGNEVDLFVKDGDKKGALPSTLVMIENQKIKVLRQGSIAVQLETQARA